MWKKRKIPASLSTVACNKASLIQKSGPTVRAVRSKHPLELGDELRQLLGNTGKALKDLRRACEAKRWKRIRIILVLNTAEGCATSLATDKILQLIFPCGLPYVQIGGAHLKINKKNESEGAVVRNRFKIIFTKTLKPCKIIFLLSTHPPKIISYELTKKYLEVVPLMLPNSSNHLKIFLKIILRWWKMVMYDWKKQ